MCYFTPAILIGLACVLWGLLIRAWATEADEELTQRRWGDPPRRPRRSIGWLAAAEHLAGALAVAALAGLTLEYSPCQ